MVPQTVNANPDFNTQKRSQKLNQMKIIGRSEVWKHRSFCENIGPWKHQSRPPPLLFESTEEAGHLAEAYVIRLLLLLIYNDIS